MSRAKRAFVYLAGYAVAATAPPIGLAAAGADKLDVAFCALMSMCVALLALIVVLAVLEDTE